MRLSKFLIFLLLTGAVYGQELTIIKNSDAVVSIGNSKVLVLEDPQHSYTIDRVHNDTSLKFKVSTQTNQSFGISNSSYWLRFKICNQIDEKIFFRIINPLLDTAMLYGFKNNKLIIKKGVRALKFEKKIPCSAFELKIPKGDTVDFYLNVSAFVPIIVPMRVFGESQTPRIVINQLLPDISLFGAILMMMFYNLFIGISTKSKSYIIYFFLSLSVGLTLFFLRGYSIVILGKYSWIIDNYFALIVSSSSIILNIFLLDFLQVKQYSLKLYRLALINISINVIIALLFILDYKNLNVKLYQAYNPLSNIIVIIIAFAILKKGFRPARYFLLAFGFFVIGTTLMNLTFANILPFTDLSIYYVHIGTFLELSIFSIALGDKINIYRKQTEEAQQKSIVLIKEQNTMLELRVNERTKDLQKAYHEIDEKHKEITDSINYAERIQRSFLATKELLDKNLKEYFVFFKPKDVVSGDFYWAAKLSNGTFALVIADSTGHGVPGAIMSILNISSLENTVEQGRLSSSEILNSTREKIINRLKNDGSVEGGSDGMDASLICFDFANAKLMYSAANNPVWVVRNNELNVLLPDKMSIGKHEKDNIPFRQSEFKFLKGDMIYALTDGMPDQFGGPKGKKFMYKAMKELLIENSNENMEFQKQKLENAFNDWKGLNEQVDDVCIVGIRL